VTWTDNQIREFRRRARTIAVAIKALVEERTGVKFGKDLHIGIGFELNFVGFDLWYQTNEQLQRDAASGRQEQLAEIMKRAARECAAADSDVRFHSHQFVRENYRGNYFEYLR